MIKLCPRSPRDTQVPIAAEQKIDGVESGNICHSVKSGCACNDHDSDDLTHLTNKAQIIRFPTGSSGNIFWLVIVLLCHHHFHRNILLKLHSFFVKLIQNTILVLWTNTGHEPSKYKLHSSLKMSDGLYLARDDLNSQRKSLISEPSQPEPGENHHFSSVPICLQRTLTRKISFWMQIFVYYPFTSHSFKSSRVV